MLLLLLLQKGQLSSRCMLLPHSATADLLIAIRTAVVQHIPVPVLLRH
jgi:hypothetical protein